MTITGLASRTTGEFAVSRPSRFRCLNQDYQPALQAFKRLNGCCMFWASWKLVHSFEQMPKQLHEFA